MSIPRLTHTRDELRAALAEMRRLAADDPRRTVALVPTMGALHEGHRALLRQARGLADVVAVSVFINPLQFVPGEDLDRYPRKLDADLAMCQQEDVDLVWAPSQLEVYPRDPVVTVSAGALGSLLEGATRPGHFDGVLTVVTKLFSVIRPDIAVFGAKDAQQLVLVRALVADLDLGVRIEAVPTVRESDGLARSSRNAYLDPEQRVHALVLSRALRAGADRATEGADAVRHAAQHELASEPGVRTDYLALVEPTSLAELGENATGDALLLVAAWVGPTRLIDNTQLVLS